MKRRIQVSLVLMPGSELWVRVEHPWGAFKLPADSPITDILTGVSEHWSLHMRCGSTVEATVRVPLSEWKLLNELKAIEEVRRARARTTLTAVNKRTR